MRDRLKALILASDILCHICGENTDSYCAEFLADYLLANGVIVPPCKVGDMVWLVDLRSDEESMQEFPFITEGKVESFSMDKECLRAYCRYKSGLTFWHIVEEDFGRDVFLTREEAEAALKGGAE